MIAAMVGRQTAAGVATPGSREARWCSRSGASLDVPSRRGWQRVLDGVDLRRPGRARCWGSRACSAPGGPRSSRRCSAPATGAAAARSGSRASRSSSRRPGRPAARDRPGDRGSQGEGAHLEAVDPRQRRRCRRCRGCRGSASARRAARRGWPTTSARLGVRCTGIEQLAATLSGGNQQKVVIGKWLATGPRVLLLDEPTRGIDVGAKQEIYALIRALAGEGLAIVMVSSELPELLLLADRIMVVSEGRRDRACSPGRRRARRRSCTSRRRAGRRRGRWRRDRVASPRADQALLGAGGDLPDRGADLPGQLQGQQHLPLLRQPARRAAAGLDHRADRHRHDGGDPDRGDRPLGRLDHGALLGGLRDAADGGGLDPGRRDGGAGAGADGPRRARRGDAVRVAPCRLRARDRRAVRGAARPAARAGPAGRRRGGGRRAGAVVPAAAGRDRSSASSACSSSRPASG